MPYTREALRDSFERGGDAHWRSLVQHHEDAYPASRPTPGHVCRAEADRLNALGLGDTVDFELIESRAERLDSALRITHVLHHRPLDLRLLTEPFTGYE